MRIIVRFIDGEEIEAESESVNPERIVFVINPTEGNNRQAWVSMASIKYIKYPDLIVPSTPGTEGHAPPENPFEADPSGAEGLDKLILRFVDGEILKAYRDSSFMQEGHCFNVRIFDPGLGRLVRTVVSLYTLKAVFFVKTWDSRQPTSTMTPSQRFHALAANRQR